MTPHELRLIVDNYNEIRQENKEEALTMAYLNAKWYRLKRMPSLKDVLEQSRPKKVGPQTDQDMFNAVMRLMREE